MRYKYKEDYKNCEIITKWLFKRSYSEDIFNVYYKSNNIYIYKRGLGYCDLLVYSEELILRTYKGVITNKLIIKNCPKNILLIRKFFNQREEYLNRCVKKFKSTNLIINNLCSIHSCSLYYDLSFDILTQFNQILSAHGK